MTGDFVKATFPNPRPYLEHTLPDILPARLPPSLAPQLTSVYENVFLDFSLRERRRPARHAQAGPRLAPTNKILWSTDGISGPNRTTWVLCRLANVSSRSRASLRLFELTLPQAVGIARQSTEAVDV
ncbi:uncharacterized protein BXZ73DRAFT_105907 [Epithele typhae]|uniref:uncharacterized protein n=1 Tax=Epithele typhae TaxID=378194 RepID=UPI002007CC71|nr:uncharacterized protein BXZ73DRAFT_105907 [Epithele typhae]KAH9916279.1 hypothetical protein BXZ73DRAFT_105907 [Epithele typhae]